MNAGPTERRPPAHTHSENTKMLFYYYYNIIIIIRYFILNRKPYWTERGTPNVEMRRRPAANRSISAIIVPCHRTAAAASSSDRLKKRLTGRTTEVREISRGFRLREPIYMLSTHRRVGNSGASQGPRGGS